VSDVKVQDANVPNTKSSYAYRLLSHNPQQPSPEDEGYDADTSEAESDATVIHKSIENYPSALPTQTEEEEERLRASNGDDKQYSLRPNEKFHKRIFTRERQDAVIAEIWQEVARYACQPLNHEVCNNWAAALISTTRQLMDHAEMEGKHRILHAIMLVK